MQALFLYLGRMRIDLEEPLLHRPGVERDRKLSQFAAPGDHDVHVISGLIALEPIFPAGRCDTVGRTLVSRSFLQRSNDVVEENASLRIVQLPRAPTQPEATVLEPGNDVEVDMKDNLT